MKETSPVAPSSAEGVVEPVSQRKTLLSGRRAQPWRKWLVILILVVSDILLAFLVWELATVLQGIWGRGSLTQVSAVSVVTNVAGWVVLRALLGLYPGYGLNQPEELRRQTYAVAATFAIIAVFALAFQVGDSLSRLMTVLGFLSIALLAPLVRHFIKWGMMRTGLWGKPVAMLGAGETAAHLVRILQSEWNLGFRPIAVFGDRLALETGALEGVPYGGTLADAVVLAEKQRIDTVIIAMPRTRREDLAELVNELSVRFRQVIIIPNLDRVTSSAVVTRDFAGTFGVEIKHNLLNPWILRTKRVLDIGCVIAGGALIFSLFLVISLLIWLESRGPVIYRDQRLGKNGKLYSCLKFRTMGVDAETMLPTLLERNPMMREEYLTYHKIVEDPRITRVGRLLRKTSLDELPQVWNVLRGEMSLVGPRPYKPREAKDIGPLQSEILRVPPGISGLWQVTGRNRTTFEERVQMDAYYVRDWSIWLDLVILARTLGSVVTSRGAF